MCHSQLWNETKLITRLEIALFLFVVADKSSQKLNQIVLYYYTQQQAVKPKRTQCYKKIIYNKKNTNQQQSVHKNK